MTARTETRAGGFSWLPVIVGFAPLPCPGLDVRAGMW